MDILKILRERRQRLGELANQRRQKRQARARIIIKSRIDEVLDPRSAKRLFDTIRSSNPLSFPGYTEKTQDLVKRSGRPDAFICATGTIDGRQVVCAGLLSGFWMGSVGAAGGEAVTRGAEYAAG